MGMGIQQKIPHNNQSRHPNLQRKSIERWRHAYCRGGGFINFNTLRYPYKNGYLMAYPPGRVSDSRGNLRSPTHKKTATQQSTNIGQQLQASVMVQEGPKDKYNAQKSK